MCSSSISYMLTAACCGCIGKSRYLLCHKIKHINIVLYITMLNPLRVVMIDLLYSKTFNKFPF